MKEHKKMGRPPVENKFTKTFGFPCGQEMVDALETFRAEHGLRSSAEAARLILSERLKLPDPKK